MSKRPHSLRSRQRAALVTVPPGSRAPRIAGLRIPRVWLTRLAMGIAVAVVIARLMMSETLREPTTIIPGSIAAPAAPGPASGLLLDLLAGLCPILVLCRRCVEPSFRLKMGWSSLAFLILGAWAVASTFWAGDRFAAAVSATHLLAAGGLLWAAMQSVRTWRHLWAVSALASGLLAILLTQGLWYHLFDRQDLIKQWNDPPTREKMLHFQNIEPGTFAAIQLENSILHAEWKGFSLSPNTYGAMLSMLAIATLGVAIDCVIRRRWVAFSVAVILIPVAIYALWMSQSRTAWLTFGSGIVALPIIAEPLSNLLRRRATNFYLLGLLAVCGIATFIISYGITHGTLFHDSLNFRWRYWVGSATLARIHPLFGVGWENFGAHYLGVRLPEATEEIKDPHNFLVRFTTELGVIGGSLALFWTARTWWELSRPTDPAADLQPSEKPIGANVLVSLALPIVLGMLLNILASIDLSADASFVALELVRRGLFFIVLTSVSAILLLRRLPTDQAGDVVLAVETTPAPWLRAGLLIGLGTFMVHSLVDFAMFEPGAMFLFSLLLGSAIGIRLQPPAGATSSLNDGSIASIEVTDEARRSQRKRMRLVRITTALVGSAWTLLAILLVVPIASAESSANQADDDLRQNRPMLAAVEYEAAFKQSIHNADYAMRAARARRFANDTPRAAMMYDLAIAADPTASTNYAERADFRTIRPQPDWPSATEDLAIALSLDPMNRPLRIRYAEALEHQNQPEHALLQVLTALDLNERLTQEERRRFSRAELFSAFRMVGRLALRVIFKF